MTNKPLIFYYDIETELLKLLAFRLGKQVLTANQLCPKNQITRIICVQYCWNDGKKPKYVLGDEEGLAFIDECIKKADIVIGKNNTKFDNKHLNTHRLLSKRDGMPDWLYKSEDLETQFRRYFNLPSQGLDYISNLLGLGGKDKMEFQDWVNILLLRELSEVESALGKAAADEVARIIYNTTLAVVKREGKKSHKTMCIYGCKDVADTRAVHQYAQKHFIHKHIHPTVNLKEVRCINPLCGSLNVIKNGTRWRGKTLHQNYFCKDHGGHAGSAPIAPKSGTHGKLGK